MIDLHARNWTTARPTSWNAVLAAALCLCSLALQGCASEEEGSTPLAPAGADEAAVEIWAHPDSVGITVFDPLDLKAASRDVVWAIDGFTESVLRYDDSKGEYGVIGLEDRPPAEIVKPARLAVTPDAGIFVFDDSTGMIDLYSPGGQHLRGFDPGLRPSILEVSQHPLRLTYGVLTFPGRDTVATLSVIQSDFLGQKPDTILSPDVGPGSLRKAKAVSGGLVEAPADDGLWIYVTAMSDTVFEVSSSAARKLVLPETDSTRIGILTDLQQQILWVVSLRPVEGLEYEAYDISGEGSGGIIDGRNAYLGARTTPGRFTASVAFDGSVSGWWISERNVFAPMGFDMRIEDLRKQAEQARANRGMRRAEIAQLRAQAAAFADSLRRAAREEGAEE